MTTNKRISAARREARLLRDAQRKVDEAEERLENTRAYRDQVIQASPLGARRIAEVFGIGKDGKPKLSVTRISQIRRGE